MASTGKAADSGNVADAFTAVNTALQNRVSSGANVTVLSSGTATSGYVPVADGSGGIQWSAISSGSTSSTTTTYIYNGINISGMEFADAAATLPGTAGSDYFVPVAADFTYLAGRGVQKVRLPFLMERATDPSTLVNLVNLATAAGIKTVVLDQHEYAREYVSGTQELLGSGLPDSTWVQQWVNLATTSGLMNNSAVEFDLMNEPHDLPPVAGTWTESQSLYTFASDAQNWKSEDGNGVLVQAASTDSSVTTGVIRLTTGTGFTSARYNDGAANAATTFTGPGIRARMRCTNTASGTVKATLQVQNSSFSFSAGPNSDVTDISDGAWHDVFIADLTGYEAADSHKGIAIQIDGPAGCVVEVDTVDLGTMTGALTGAQVWEQASQQCVTALRNAGVNNWLNVESYDWGTMDSINTQHTSGWWITDPQNKTRLSMHYYLQPGGGYKNADNSELTYAQNLTNLGITNLQTQHMQPALDTIDAWLSSSSAKPDGVWIGEIGWPGGSFATSADQTSWNTDGAWMLDQFTSRGWSFTYWGVGSGYGTGYDLSAYYSTGSTVPLNTASTQAPILESRYTHSTTTTSGSTSGTTTTSPTASTVDYSTALI